LPSGGPTAKAAAIARRYQDESRLRGLDEARLREIADLADPDEWRVRFRDPDLWRNLPALDQLADRLAAATPPASTMVRLARHFLVAKAPQKAVAVLVRALQRDPADFWLNYELAMLLWRHSKTLRKEEAVGYMQAAMVVRPHNYQVNHSLAVLLQDTKRFDQAVAAYRRTIDLRPDEVALYRQLGTLLADMGRWEEAIDLYTRGLTKTGTPAVMATVLNRRGDAYHHLGRWEQAIADYSALIDSGSMTEVATNSLAWILATCPRTDLRDPARAVALATAVVGKVPGNSGYWRTKGIAHYRAGDWSSAVESLNQSMTLRKGEAGRDWFFMAMAHWRLGKLDQARQWYDKIAAWTDKRRDDEEFQRFRAEAAALLGVDNRPLGPRPMEPPRQ
jgi:tetratricopeptide (TPR) repeat protein